MSLMLIMKKLSREDDALIIVNIEDILSACKAAQSMRQMGNLTDAMKSSISDGVYEVKVSLCEKIIEYYTDHEIPINPQTVELMRDAVATYFERGGSRDF